MKEKDDDKWIKRLQILTWNDFNIIPNNLQYTTLK